MRINDGTPLKVGEIIVLTDCFASLVTAENTFVGDIIKCIHCGLDAEVISTVARRWHWQITCTTCGYQEDTGMDLYARTKRRRHLEKYPDHVFDKMRRVYDDDGSPVPPRNSRTNPET